MADLIYVLCFGDTSFRLKLLEVHLFIGNAFLFYKARSIKLHYLSYLYLSPNMLRGILLFIVASGIGLVFYIPEGRFLLTSVVFLRDMASEMIITYYSSEEQFCLLFGYVYVLFSICKHKMHSLILPYRIQVLIRGIIKIE